MIVLITVFLAYTQLTGSTVLIEYPKLTTLAYGGQFLQATTLMQVSRITLDTHMPYRRNMLISWSLMALNAYSLIRNGVPMFDEFWTICAINLITWSAYAHFIYYVLQDLKRILDVNIFTIKFKKPNVEDTSSKKDKKKGSHKKKN